MDDQDFSEETIRKHPIEAGLDSFRASFRTRCESPLTLDALKRLEDTGKIATYDV